MSEFLTLTDEDDGKLFRVRVVEDGAPLATKAVGDLAIDGEGRRARSDPLLVAVTSRFVMKTKR